MRPDINVGSCFARWLDKYHPESADNFTLYPHTITDKMDVDARQYPRSMKPLFEEFVEDYWLPNNAERYFKDRDANALQYLPKLLKAS